MPGYQLLQHFAATPASPRKTMLQANSCGVLDTLRLLLFKREQKVAHRGIFQQLLRNLRLNMRNKPKRGQLISQQTISYLSARAASLSAWGTSCKMDTRMVRLHVVSDCFMAGLPHHSFDLRHVGTMGAGRQVPSN